MTYGKILLISVVFLLGILLHNFTHPERYSHVGSEKRMFRYDGLDGSAEIFQPEDKVNDDIGWSIIE